MTKAILKMYAGRPGGDGTARTPKQPDRGEVPADEREAYDAVMARFTDRANTDGAGAYFGALLNSPRFASLLSSTGLTARLVGEKEGSFTHADRELIDQVLASDYDFSSFLDVHIPDAISVGVRVEAIEAIREGRDDDLTADERLLVKYVRQVAGGTVDDDTWWAVQRRFGSVRGIVEYTIFVAFLQLIIRLYQAFGIVGPSKDQVSEWLAAYKAGSVSLPDWREQMR